jgi:hypothetical protein
VKTGAVVALVAIPVVLGGGVAAFFLLRKKQAGDRGARDLAASQMAMGSKAVASGPSNAPPPLDQYGRPLGQTGGGGGGGGGNFSLTGVATGVAGKYANSIIPGSGALVGTAATAAGSLLKKIPGLGSIGSKLKFW